MGASVLVLGGYGTTGTILSELVLAWSDADVVIAGRDLGRAQRVAAALATRYPGRVGARQADAADPASLARALAGVKLMAVAAPVLAHVETVATAALDAGADYFDLLLSSPVKHAALERLRPRIEAEGRRFVTDGGLHPGLSAAMVRALAPRFARLERADIGGLIRADWTAYDFSLDTISEFAEEMGEYRAEALRDGVWRAAHRREMTRMFDFGSPWTRQACFLMSLEELRRLPQSIPSLRDCGFYVSGFNPVVDWLLMPAGMLAMKVAPEAAAAPYARLLAAALRRFGRPPFGCVWQVEARGQTADGRRELGLRVGHADGYWLTAASAAACLRQCLDGSLTPQGVQLQALAVAPARFLRDLHDMGAEIAGRGVNVGKLLA